MEYKIDISAEAQTDIHSIYLKIQEDAPEAAKQWRKRIESVIDSLGYLPFRHGVASESKYCRLELRETFHGQYRVIYYVHEETVSIVTIRHGARRKLSRRESDERL